MKRGFVGLGKVGLNMVKRLTSGGHEIIAFDVSGDAVQRASADGGRAVDSLEALSAALTPPRSRTDNPFAERMLAALRPGSHGH